MNTVGGSEAVNFYDSLQTEADLNGLIGMVREGLYVEFKKKKHAANDKLHDSDRRTFSKALSGFANSDGGALVWGMATDENSCASALDPITSVDEFVNALQKSIINTTQPLVDGVKVEKIASSIDGAGYVKCFIPASDKAPHRAMLAEREYFKRSVEGFYRLEHFDLEDMFGRRPRPVLVIKHRVGPVSMKLAAGKNIKSAQISFEMENTGRGSALAPYVELSSPEQLHACGIAKPGGDVLFYGVPYGPGMRFLGTADFVIHPGTSYEFAFAEAHFQEGTEDGLNFKAHYRVAAMNTNLKEGMIDISASEIRKKLGIK
jgi:hypothetical protein